MKIVISSTPSSGGKIKFFIVATIPEFWPLTLVPFPSLFEIILLKYTDTSIPKCVEFIFAEKYVGSYSIPPGMTIEPSLNICLPKLSTWFCKSDCKPVNSLACTGYPGLNKIL